MSEKDDDGIGDSDSSEQYPKIFNSRRSGADGKSIKLPTMTSDGFPVA